MEQTGKLTMHIWTETPMDREQVQTMLFKMFRDAEVKWFNDIDEIFCEYIEPMDPYFGTVTVGFEVKVDIRNEPVCIDSERTLDNVLDTETIVGTCKKVFEPSPFEFEDYELTLDDEEELYRQLDEEEEGNRLYYEESRYDGYNY